MFKVIILLRYIVLYINYFSTIFPFHLSPVVIFTYDPFVCFIYIIIVLHAYYFHPHYSPHTRFTLHALWIC